MSYPILWRLYTWRNRKHGIFQCCMKPLVLPGKKRDRKRCPRKHPKTRNPVPRLPVVVPWVSLMAQAVLLLNGLLALLR